MDIRSVYHKALPIILVLSFGVACTSANLTTQPTIEPAPAKPVLSPVATTLAHDPLLSSVIQNCLTVQPTISGDVNLSGKLIVNSNSAFSIVSLPGFEIKPLPESFWPVLISPDRKRIAVLEWDEPFQYTRLVILNAKGQSVMSFDWEAEWEIPTQWVNPDNLLVRTSDLSSPVLLNVVTGEKQQIVFPYGNEVYVSDVTGPEREKFIIYNSTMTKVFYENKGRVFILRDMDSSENLVLWARHSHLVWPSPAWSPNSDWIAFTFGNANIEDLYLVDAVGFSEVRLTDFDSLYNRPLKVFVDNINWAFDGKSLAIHLKIQKQESQSQPETYVSEDRLLTVRNLGNLNSEYPEMPASLRLEDVQIIDYCLTNSAGSVWSPDSRYIALASGNSNDRITTIIIDVKDQKIYKIMDGYIPVGWLVDD